MIFIPLLVLLSRLLGNVEAQVGKKSSYPIGEERIEKKAKGREGEMKAHQKPHPSLTTASKG